MNKHAAVATSMIVLLVTLVIIGGGGAGVYLEDVKSRDIAPADISAISSAADDITKEQLNSTEAIRQVCEYFGINYTQQVADCLEKLNVQVYGLNGTTMAEIVTEYRKKCVADGYTVYATVTWTSDCYDASGFFAKGILHGRLIAAIEQSTSSQCPVIDMWPNYDVILVTSSAFLMTYKTCFDEFTFVEDYGIAPSL